MLEVKNVSKIFGAGEAKVIALDGISFTINSGDFVAVMGPSGSGKSTLLNIIGGLDRISAGEVILDGKRIDSLDEEALVEIRRRKIGYVFQMYHLIPSLTAFENVLLPLTFSGNHRENEKSLAILERVGLGKRAYHKPGQLSGGEQQRVAIARALVSNPELILADEPTGNVDQKNGAEIMKLFESVNRGGQTIIMVTHAPEIARFAHEILFLKDGRLVERRNNKSDRGILAGAEEIRN